MDATDFHRKQKAMNNAFCGYLYRTWRSDMERIIGKTKTAKILSRRNMSIMKGIMGIYFIEINPDGEYLKEKLYAEETCGNMAEAKARAVQLWIAKAFPDAYDDDGILKPEYGGEGA